MKKFFLCFFAIASFSIMLESCHPGSDPKIVAEKFMQAVKATDFDKAKKYATKDSEEMLNLLASVTNAVPQAKEKIQHADISIKGVQVDGDKATVTYFNKEDNKEETLNMRKENGEWKVAFTKENYLPDMKVAPGQDSSLMRLPPVSDTAK